MATRVNLLGDVQTQRAARAVRSLVAHGPMTLDRVQTKLAEVEPKVSRVQTENALKTASRAGLARFDRSDRNWRATAPAMGA